MLDFSRPGKPTDNAFIESFYERLQQECLNENWFLSPEDAQTKIENWRNHYSEKRPHGSLRNLAPSEFANAGQKAMTEEHTDFLVMIGTEIGQASIDDGLT